MRRSVSALSVLFCIFMLVPRADAQSTHAAQPSAIDQALAQHVDSADSDRALVQRVLEQPAVRALANELGIDVRRAQSAAASSTPPGSPSSPPARLPWIARWPAARAASRSRRRSSSSGCWC
jgi:hypothetical protein